MGDILEGLDEWSFKGVPFLAAETSTTGGRKTVTHEFVNSPRREVEDLGLQQKVFSLRAIISNKDNLYFQKRNALINALDEGGKGILSHAFLGKFEVVSKPYTLTERISDLGAAFFDLIFERADDAIIPLPDAFSFSEIQQIRTDTMNALAAEFERTPPNGFKVSQAFPFNFTAATNILDSIGNRIESITSTFNRAVQEIDNFAANINNFRNNIRRLIGLPSQLTTSLTNLYNSVVALAETPQEAVLTLEKLFDFGSDFPVLAEITAERIERKKNQDLLTKFMQIGALAYAYEQVSSIPFFTIREIDSFSDKLNRQFNFVYPTITDQRLALILRNLRNTTNEFLDIQRLNVKKIVDFETPMKPAQVLTYELYGALDNFERLVALNSVTNIEFMSGSVEVFR